MNLSNFDFGLVATNQTEVNESPLLWLPGVDAAFQVLVKGTGTLASVTMELYENGTDVSNNVTGARLTGSTSISGRVITGKILTSLAGGSFYKWYLRFTDGGLSQVREGSIIVPKLGVSPSNYPGAINTLRVDESPITLYPGQSITPQLIIDGQGPIASVTMSAYKGTSDLSTTVLSGSASVSGRTITLKTIASLTTGIYIVYVFFTDAGQSTVRYFEILVPKLGS